MGQDLVRISVKLFSFWGHFVPQHIIFGGIKIKLELIHNNFQYGLKQALQLLIYTLITVVVVMFVAGDAMITNFCQNVSLSEL